MLKDYQGKRAVALVSGGLDSVVSLAQAGAVMEVRLVLFFDYGQRALDRERNAVLGVVNYYAYPLREVRVEWLGELAPMGMRRLEPAASPADAPALDTLDAVWVPNRNGVFLNIGAAFAEAYGCDCVVTGFNREEAAEFPDNSQEYIARVSEGLELSTRNGVQIVSFTQDLDKRQVLVLGARLGAPLSVIWSCYHAGRLMCGRCTSCRRLKAALAGVDEGVRPPLEFES
jgi:7-cyano-7-deazaguanine synthase